MSGPSGILIVDKPGGPTSHDVVSRARRLLGTRAVGHAGTLDPMATGVMVLLVGEATKLSPYLTADDKRYRATVTFGTATDTLDAWGTIVEESGRDLTGVSDEELGAAMAAELARTDQLPPRFSAIRVGGRRAHAESRRGRMVDLPARPVNVRKLTLLERDSRSAVVDLTVSKGYYVRAFARDLARELGLVAHLSALRRLSSGAFGIDEACGWPPDESPRLMDLALAAGRALPTATLTERGVSRARVGKCLEPDDFERPPSGGSPAAWLGPSGVLVAIGVGRQDGSFAVVRGFRT